MGRHAQERQPHDERHHGHDERERVGPGTPVPSLVRPRSARRSTNGIRPTTTVMVLSSRQHRPGAKLREDPGNHGHEPVRHRSERRSSSVVRAETSPQTAGESRPRPGQARQVQAHRVPPRQPRRAGGAARSAGWRRRRRRQHRRPVATARSSRSRAEVGPCSPCFAADASRAAVPESPGGAFVSGPGVGLTRVTSRGSASGLLRVAPVQIVAERRTILPVRDR